MSTLFNNKLIKIIFNRFYSNWPFLIGLCAGFYFFILNITGFDFTYLPGNLGDARFNIYILEHAHQYFILDNVPSSSYWSAPFMYPEPAIITYSDNLLGTFPIYSIFRLLGVNIYLSFSCWFALITILNYSCSFLFLNWLLKNKYAAVIGAYIFAFSLVLVSQSFHAQTFPRFFIPLALWAGCLYYKNFSVNYFFLATLLLVFQFYSGMYLGFMLFIPLSILILYGIISRYNLFIKSISTIKSISKFLGSILFPIILLLPIIIPYNERSKKVGLKSYEEIYESIPSFYSYLNSNWSSSSWQFLSTKFNKHFVNWWDHELFLGGVSYFAIVICIIYLFWKYKKLFRIRVHAGLIITSIITFLLFFRVDDFSFYKYLMFLPGFASMRALQRVINLELIFVALAVASFFILLSRTTNNRYLKTSFFFLFLTLVITDNLFESDRLTRLKITDALNRESYLTKKLSGLNKGQIFSYEPDTIINSSVDYHLDAMLVAQKLSLKTINGYSATCPNSYSPFWETPTQENREFWLKDFKIDEEIQIIN